MSLLRLIDPTWRVARATDTPPRCIHVLPKHRIVWVMVRKSGCTSILEMLSRLEGGGSLAPDESVGPGWSVETGWHDQQVHGLPRLTSLGRSVRRDALHAPGWWRFAVVRDPYSRFLSAWADRVFLRTAVDPMLLEDVEDVILDDGRIDMTATFSQFARVVLRSPSRYLSNPHFAPQHTLLCRDIFPDIEVFPLSRIDEVCMRLAAVTGVPAALRRLNSSLTLDPARLYRHDARQLVSTLYRDDLGCDPTVPAPPESPSPALVLTSIESELVRRFRDARRRIGQLSAHASRQSRVRQQLRRLLHRR